MDQNILRLNRVESRYGNEDILIKWEMQKAFMEKGDGEKDKRNTFSLGLV